MPPSINCRVLAAEGCDAIRFDTNRFETKRIEYLLPLLASRLKNLLLSKFYPERFNSLAGCLRGAANTSAQTRTEMQTQTHRQGVDSESKRSVVKSSSPNLRLPTIHLVASEFLTQRFHFIFLGKFLACSVARWHCMKFAQLPVGCSLFFSTFHNQLPLSFSVDCPYPSPPLPPSAVVLVKHFVIVYFTLAFVLYLFSISAAPTVLDLFLP